MASGPALAAPFCWDGDHLRVDLPAGRALFTTRRGGVSSGPYSSLNLGPWTGDDPAAIAANRDRVAGRAGRRLCGVRQVHGTAVHAVDDTEQNPLTDAVEADALLTTSADVAVGVLTADCLAILLIADGAVAAVHAGWRGLAAGIIPVAIARLAAEGVPATAVHALIGPAARVCCYEVGDEVRAAFADSASDVREGRRINLPLIAERALRDAGVPAVHDCGRCTLCAPAGLFFSHRRDGGTTGRQIGLAWRS